MLRHFLYNQVRPWLVRGRNFLAAPLLEAMERAEDRGPAQLALSLTYRQMARNGDLFPRISDAGFRVYSQFEEDGILLYLFSLIGMETRRCLDICLGVVESANTTNWIVSHGFTGVLIEGSPALTAHAQHFYATHPSTRDTPPTVVNAWITRDNINALVQDNGLSGEIDLLSLDIDGMDYWIWEALTVVRPRIVVAEIRAQLGAEASVTVPYSTHFRTENYPMLSVDVPYFAGASYAAFVKLAKRKGYRLVGSNRQGFNAFFVREDLAPDLLPEVSIASCLTHPLVEARAKASPQFDSVPWQQV